MKSVNLLLAGADQRMNNAVEAAVRDVCYGHALVECTWCSRLDEFTLHGKSKWLDLIVVAPGNLLSAANRRGSQAALEQTLEVIRTIKSRHTLPVFAVSVALQDQMALLEAGVDHAFGFPLDTDALKNEVRNALRLSGPVAVEEEVNAWSLGALLLRGWQRLKNA